MPSNAAIDRAKRDAEAAHWQVIREAHDRLNRVVAQEPLRDACHWLDFHLWCAEVQRQYKETMMRLQRMENITGLTEQLYDALWPNTVHHATRPFIRSDRRRGAERATKDPKTPQRYTSTGIFECVSTLTVSLPRTTAEIPRRPCEAIMIKSHVLAEAASMIA